MNEQLRAAGWWRLVLAVAWLVAVSCGLTRAAAVADDAPRGWRAGVARRSITPTEPMWMSGYAGRDHAASETLTELWAKALVLEDASGRRGVLITVDLVGIDRDVAQAVCRRLEDAFHLPRASVAICASHTHTGPVVGRNLRGAYFLDNTQTELVSRYTQGLEDTLIAVVRGALEALGPAQLDWGLGETDFAVNRRNNPEPDVPALRAAGKLQGPVDHDVPVLRVLDADGTLRAVVFGYACHATVLSSYEWSGDYPGFAQLDVEERHAGATAMFWAGCGADQNPLPRRTVELAKEYGKQLADAVDQVLAGKLQPIAASLTTEYAEIPLKFAHIPTREELTATARSSDRHEARRAQVLLEDLGRGEPIAESYPYPIETWRLGENLRWVFLGGEVVVDYALRLKHELPRQETWVTGYANDVMAYIASRRVLGEGGYEGVGAMVYYGLPSAWDASIEDAIVGEVMRQASAPAAENATPKAPE